MYFLSSDFRAIELLPGARQGELSQKTFLLSYIKTEERVMHVNLGKTHKVLQFIFEEQFSWLALMGYITSLQTHTQQHSLIYSTSYFKAVETH